ncbi:hypothetical protein CANMA_005418 [Candida margitis]|uniref:uncharacterized protein n=1 Tax=Candida margitis TaxID=1775924 RepID=UPI0022278E69|nr:uncharacterized protein CANMA_005418 [Candida margitis]KAI5949838.1 hypothetical protein CANMA_005418 [Candida margitis]
MFCLLNLPHEVLQVVFLHINQHQVLALAPLHSRFYCLAKPKLYQNIHVYEAWPLKGEEEKGGNLRFKFHKGINNIIANQYTIVSRHNYEKYLSQMSSDKKIDHIILKDFHQSLSVRILKHFRSIQRFEMISAFHNRYEDFSELHDGSIEFMLFGEDEEILPYVLIITTEFIPAPYYLDAWSISACIQTSLNVIVYCNTNRNYNYLDLFTLITSLTIVVMDNYKFDGRQNLRLRKLHIHQVEP